MANCKHQDFSQLYRAAFAEKNPARKATLLAEVQQAIEQWEQMLQNWVAPKAEPLGCLPDASERSISISAA